MYGVIFNKRVNESPCVVTFDVQAIKDFDSTSPTIWIGILGADCYSGKNDFLYWIS